MTQPSDATVFDTGPLRHFAVQGWLGVLKFLTADRGIAIPESVEYELRRQVHEIPAVRQVLDADWIFVDRSDDLPFLLAFAKYEQRLATGEQNRGECGVLALGEVRGLEVVLDDSSPRAIAEAASIRVTATLPLLCRGIRESQLTVPMVESLADDLLAGVYYLPFRKGGFRQWALQEGSSTTNESVRLPGPALLEDFRVRAGRQSGSTPTRGGKTQVSVHAPIATVGRAKP